MFYNYSRRKEDADIEKRTSEADLKQAKENKELARLEWVQAVNQLNRRTLRSPFDGVVIDQYIFPGEVVDASTQRPILKLAQADPLRVEVILILVTLTILPSYCPPLASTTINI